ncbi:MAG: hypothetical protein D6692_02515 [Planctomycetota bacterium]|nr:MAG: hypothetical protein D6692_02515 [Planctomycetota bacterium]
MSCASTNGSQLRVFDLYGGQEDLNRADGWLPAGIGFTDDDRLYQWQQNGGPLWAIDKQTGVRLDPLINQNAGGSCQGRDFLFLPNGTTLVGCGSSGTVKQFDSDTGAYLGNFANCDVCRGLCLDRDGFVLSSSQTSIQRWNADTGQLEGIVVAPGTGGLEDAYDIVLDNNGDILVSDVTTGRILRFDAETGTHLNDATEFAMTGARGMATWRDSDLFVSAWHGPLGGGVYRFDLESGEFKDFYQASAAMFVAITDCRIDYDCDERATFFDISGMLLLYQAQAEWADFNEDGSWNFFDIAAFLDEYLLGC